MICQNFLYQIFPLDVAKCSTSNNFINTLFIKFFLMSIYQCFPSSKFALYGHCGDYCGNQPAGIVTMSMQVLHNSYIVKDKSCSCGFSTETQI